MKHECTTAVPRNRIAARRRDKMPFKAGTVTGMKQLRSYSARYGGHGDQRRLLAIHLQPHEKKECYGRRSERGLKVSVRELSRLARDDSLARDAGDGRGLGAP